MSRYIDAEWLVKESMSLSFSVQKWANEVQIMTAPSIDIVRCRECKYWKEGKCWNLKGLNKTDGIVNADDFCSYGERREL